MTATNVLEPPSMVDRVFGAAVEAQTWRNVLYLAISFPLGVFYFVLTVTGICLGVGLALIAVGIPILVFTLMLVGLFGRLERTLLRNLLQARLSDPTPAPLPAGILESLRAYLRRPETWKTVVYALVHLPFSVIAFGLVMSFIPAGAALMLTPLTYTLVPIDMFGAPVTSLDQAVLCCSIGAILMLIGLHLMNGWAMLWKRVGGALLE
jgi:hypothetical protein